MKYINTLLPLLAVIGSVTALGIGTSWAKADLFPVIGAQGTTALRLGFSALFLMSLWRPWRWTISRSNWLFVIGYGLSLAGSNFMFYMSLKTLPFGLAVAIEFSGPLAIALFSSFSVTNLIWVVCAFTGLGLLLPLNEADSAPDLFGTLYALAAAAFWMGYIKFGKRLSHLHAGHSVSLGLIVAALVTAPAGIYSAGAALFSPSVLLIGAGVAVIASAIPISLEMLAIKRISAGSFGILISLEPAVAAVLGYLVLSEKLSLLQWIAVILIIMASIGNILTAHKPAVVNTAE